MGQGTAMDRSILVHYGKTAPVGEAGHDKRRYGGEDGFIVERGCEERACIGQEGHAVLRLPGLRQRLLGLDQKPSAFLVHPAAGGAATLHGVDGWPVRVVGCAATSGSGCADEAR